MAMFAHWCSGYCVYAPCTHQDGDVCPVVAGKRAFALPHQVVMSFDPVFEIPGVEPHNLDHVGHSGIVQERVPEDRESLGRNGGR